MLFIRNNSDKKSLFMPYVWPFQVLFMISGNFYHTSKKDKRITKIRQILLNIMTIAINISIIASLVLWLVINNYVPGSNGIADKLQFMNGSVWFIGCLAISFLNILEMNSYSILREELFDVHKNIDKKLGNDTRARKRKENMAITVLLFMYTVASLTLVLEERIHRHTFTSLLIAIVVLKYLLSAIDIFLFQLSIRDMINMFADMLDNSLCNVREMNRSYVCLAEINRHFNKVNCKRCSIIITCSIMIIIWYAFEMGSRYISASENGAKFYDERLLPYVITAQVFIFIVISLSAIGSLKYNSASLLLLKAKKLSSVSSGTIKEHTDELISTINDLPMPLSAGWFNVDFSFLTSVTGHIITYLVILLQFQHQYDESKEIQKTAAVNTSVEFI